MTASNSQVSHAMNQNELLFENIDRLHTTPMGIDMYPVFWTPLFELNN